MNASTRRNPCRRQRVAQHLMTLVPFFRSPLLDEAEVQGQGNSLGLVGRAELLDDVIDVESDGAFADGKCSGHFRSGFTMRREGQYFNFTG